MPDLYHGSAEQNIECGYPSLAHAALYLPVLVGCVRLLDSRDSVLGLANSARFDGRTRWRR